MSKNDPKSKNATSVDPMSKRPDYLKKDQLDMPVEESIRFPRLKLIQALSPEKTKGNDKYIPGLEEGTLLLQSDTMTRQIDGEEGIVVIPMAVRKRYVEYTPRDQGGGFVASYDSKEEMENQRDPSNDIQPTVEFLVIEAGADDPTPFTIVCDSVSKLVTAKKWAGYMTQYESMEGVKYLITGKQVLNKKKQAFYNFEVKPIGWVDQPTLNWVQDVMSTTTQLFLPSGTSEEI